MKYFCLSLSLLLLKFAVIGQNIEFRGKVTYNQDLSDIWGWSDGENEYAIVGFERGFSVVDVTDPEDPTILFNESGPRTIWRDIKTFGDYAYGIHENAGSNGVGLAIMDLSQLPDAFPVTYWKNDGTLDEDYLSSHNIFIDKKGFAYIVGGNELTDGVLILDLNDPLNPTVAGQYTERYVHDAFVRNDTLWTAEVYKGEFSVIDISDKSNPQVLARQETPFDFAHNIWLSNDGKTAFTTDERSGAPIASFDVSDLNDITLLDEYRTTTSLGLIPHNTHVFEEYAVVSYYREGVVILDATLPDELVRVGGYDTSPNLEGDGFNGCWGVYPYLPSGNIIASDIERGVFVLTPTYEKALHIRGKVIETGNGNPIRQANVSIGEGFQGTDFEGAFKKGFADGGTYTITASKSGFEPNSITVSGLNGEVIEVEIELERSVLIPTDTIFGDVEVNSTIAICDNNTNGITVNNAALCEQVFSSTFGTWSVENDNCLYYTAHEETGNNVDSICYVVENSATGEQNVNVVIISVGAPTAIVNNAFEEGGLSLAQNPVKDQLLLRNSINVRAPVSLKVFDTNGKLIDQKEVQELSSNMTFDVSQISKGLYILTVNSGNEHLGLTKFIKE